MSFKHPVWVIAFTMTVMLLVTVSFKVAGYIHANSKTASIIKALDVDYTVLAPKNNIEEDGDDSTQNPDINKDTYRLPDLGMNALAFVDRIHNNMNLDSGIVDSSIASPKSVSFSPDGKKVYVNSLENSKTLIYDPKTLERIGVINHKHGDRYGKPVESAFSHNGKYIWIPYYRWVDDELGREPSGVAVVDTSTDKIVRVLATGLISKNIAISGDSKYAAVTNWGENTVSLFDIGSDDAKDFSLISTLVIGKRINLALDSEEPIDHDKFCGLCVRGAAFSEDERYLLVGLMGGGGIAGFDLNTKQFLGIVTMNGFFPRDVVLGPDGRRVYASSGDGTLKRVDIGKLVEYLSRASQKQLIVPEIFQSVNIGSMPRTVEITEDNKYAFVTLNSTSEIIVVNLNTMQVIGRAQGDDYLVGLDVSPDGKSLWVTAQGRNGLGGNSINIFEIKE